MKSRILGDPAFPAKLALEVGMGMVTKVIAELEKRPGKFVAQLDLVFANVIMAMITDVMLVWIPAPCVDVFSLSVNSQHEDRPTSMIYQFWAKCPANAFQVMEKLLSAGSTFECQLQL